MTPSKHRRAMLAKETDPEYLLSIKADTCEKAAREFDVIKERCMAEIRQAHMESKNPQCDKRGDTVTRLEARAVSERVFDELDWDEE